MTIREMFDRRRREIRSKVHRLQQIEAILENGDASLQLIYVSLNEPVIKVVPSLRIIGKKGTGPYADTIRRLMGELCRQLFSPENQVNGVKVAGPFMTLNYDCEYREKDACMECAAPIAGRISLSDSEMEVRILQGGSFLSLIYKGPYSGLHGAWARIGSYAEEKGYPVTGVHREVYLNDPQLVPEDDFSPSSRYQSMGTTACRPKVFRGSTLFHLSIWVCPDHSRNYCLKQHDADHIPEFGWQVCEGSSREERQQGQFCRKLAFGEEKAEIGLIRSERKRQ